MVPNIVLLPTVFFRKDNSVESSPCAAGPRWRGKKLASSDHVCGGGFGAGRSVASSLTTYKHVVTFIYFINLTAMCPFSVPVQNAPDRALGPSLTQLSQAGFDDPIITTLAADAAFEKNDPLTGRRTAELPDDWR